MSNRTDVRRVLDTVKAEGRTALTAPEGKVVCEAYGIAVPKEGVATSAADAAKIATAMGFPVVLKIVSPDILHKTEAGGVLVGVKSAEDAQKGYDTIIANAKKYNAKANVLGVQVQEMLTGGQEVIIGAVTDPVFGKLVAFGLGGVLVEVLKDITFRLAPATEADALSMLDGIAAAQILKGVRGAHPVNRDALARMIQNVSQLIADYPEIAEMDLNPVFATGDGAIAADVRIVVNFSPAPARYRPKHEDIVRDMNRIMKPRAVAVIGASTEAGKIGNSVMKNLINGGYKGQIYPINPSADEIMGLKAYKSVKDVPGDIDVAVFAIPAKFVAGAIAECGEKKIPGAVLIPSGFAEVGNVAGQQEIIEVGRKYGVRLMGPNIYGFYYTWSNLCATFCTAYDVKGHAALSSQSGGIGMAIIGFSRSAKMGVSAIVGLGNKSDIDEDDLLTFFEQDDNGVMITGAGGSGVLLSDAVVDNGLTLMKFPPDLDAAFKKFIPPFGASGNPVDITGGEPPKTYQNTVRFGLEDPRIHALILGYWHTIVTPPMVFAKLLAEIVEEMRGKGIDKPVVVSLAGDVEVEEASEYLFDHKIPAYPYSTEIPVDVLGAKYRWARAAGLL